MESPQQLIARHLRHLDFVRTSIGGEHHERVAAFFTVTQNDPAMWLHLSPGAAGMLEVHDRAMVAMGYRRALGGDSGSIDALERAMVTRALGVWLPRLGAPGARVKRRMQKRGLLAVPHHFLSEMDSPALLACSELVRDAVFAIDDAICVAAARGDGGASWLAVQRLAVRRELVASVSDCVENISHGWEALAAYWMTLLRDLGSSANLDSTQAYTSLTPDDETGSFDLMAAYESTLA